MTAFLLAGPALVLALAAASTHVLRRRMAVVTVSGPSMQPTLHSGDRLLVRRGRAGQLRTGQIVVIARPVRGDAPACGPPRWPPAQGEWMIKRVAAVPGERTPASMLTASSRDAEPVVPPGMLVVLGDNQARSLDSRLLGFIPAGQVLGIMIRPLPGRGRPIAVAQIAITRPPAIGPQVTPATASPPPRAAGRRRAGR